MSNGRSKKPKFVKKEGTEHGKTGPMGNISHDGQGKVKEGEETDLDGFPQQPLNWVPTAGSCYLSRLKRLFHH